MTRIQRILRKLLLPPPALLVPLAAASAAGLFWVFAGGRDGSAPAIALYLLSFYTLVVWCARLPALVRWARRGPGARLARLPLVRRYRADLRFRGACSLYLGLASSLCFAAFKAASSVLYRSVWFGAVAAYYLALAVLRGALVLGLRRCAAVPPQEQRRRELRGYRRTGWLMLALTAAMSGMVTQMVRDGRGYSYPGILIYVCALYAFYAVIQSAAGWVRFRGADSPLLSAGKAVSFAGAAMSILTLQTAMLAQFDAEGALDRQLFNALTGIAVLALCFGLALHLILHGSRLLRHDVSGRHTIHGK